MAVAGNMTPCIRAILVEGRVSAIGSSYADDSAIYSDVIEAGRCRGGIKDAIDALKLGGMISVRSTDNEFLRLLEQFEYGK